MSGAYPYMLDTNAASTLIRGRAASALQKLLLDHGTCVSVITEAELRFGVTRRPEATRLAIAVTVFLQDTPVLPWTSATAHAYAELRTRMESRGVSLSAMDLLIAAHAQAEGCTLVSADRAFTRVPGLRVFDWSTSGATTAVKGAAQQVRGKLARVGITVRDIEAARAHARTPGRQTAQKTKAKKKPNKKLKAK